MTDLLGEGLERRLLVLAPVGKDASLIEAMLSKAGIACVACSDLESLAKELERGAASIVVAEEALSNDIALARVIMRQPTWSDLPVLVLTRPGADSAVVAHALKTLGNVTLLERPVRVPTLVAAARGALRARERQYQTRTYLREREEADRRKDEFLATLAHELRNPLAPLRNSITLLRFSGDARPAGPILEMMERQVEHMVRLVDDLMEVSRITRGKVELRKEVVNLGEVIVAAVETSRPLIESARHELTLTLPPEPLMVEADAMRLGQVFANLLNNAVKYTDAGGRISITARREGGASVVTVSDTGIGIAAEVLPRVFDMFVQEDAHDSRAQTGLGIGLTLVRSLVEMHGGRVTAHSAGRDEGSEFVVRLPLADKQGLRAKTRPVAARKLAGQPRVMVVDDNRDAAESMAALLEMLGAEVRVTYDGQAAIDALEQFNPAAMFLDLGMPGMDGYETVRQIRARSNARDLMIIALTGRGNEQDRRQTEAAGFNRHLVKPADLGALQAVLDSLTR